MTATANDSMINRITALLAKSESTGYGPEADAYLSKAQELMTRYSIDAAMLRVSEPAAASGVICAEIRLCAPRGRSLARFNQLLAVIAVPNSCRAFAQGSTGLGSIVGFAEDVDRVRELFALLSMQMQAECNRRMKTRVSAEHGATFRAAFYAGFTSAIAQRLQDAAAAATEQASFDYGMSAHVVLRDKREAVSQHPSLRHLSVAQTGRVRSGDGYRAGSAAGRSADLRAKRQPALPA